MPIWRIKQFLLPGEGGEGEMQEQQGKEMAAVFRSEHHLGVQPLGDLITLIEQATGHDVAVLDADPDEHGLTMYDPERKVIFVGVARTRNPMRQRSTLAHELAHVLFEDWKQEGNVTTQSARETRAEVFARHLLLPEDGLREFLGARESLSEADLSGVVQWFLVSPALAAIALHDCGYIDAAVKREWMTLSTPQLATRFGWIDQYHSLQAGSDRTRSPQRLLARAVEGYTEGVVTIQTLAALMGTSAEVATEELAGAGIVPKSPTASWMESADLPAVTVDLSDIESEPFKDSAE